MHLTVRVPDAATAFELVARIGAVAAARGRHPDIEVRTMTDLAAAMV